MKVIYSDFDGLARTNGRDIEINLKYQGTSAEKLFIFHEEGHILLDHFKRQKDRDLGLWNVAADLEIAIYLYPLQNYGTLLSVDFYENLNEAIKCLPNFKGLIFWEDPKYKAMGIKNFHIAEDIYEILKEQYERDSNDDDDDDDEALSRQSSSFSDSNDDSENDSKSSSSNPNSSRSIIEEAIKNSTDFHGSQEFKEPYNEQDIRDCIKGDSREEENNAFEKISEAVRSCQLAEEVKVKKLKINFSITDCISRVGKGTLGFQKSYSRPCRSKVGLHSDRIYKGERVVETQSEIFLFVDRSSSFNDEKTKEQEQVIADLVKKYRGRIKIKTLYFTTDIFEDKESIKGYGTNAFCCFQYIEKYRPAMSIIITDDDWCCGYENLNLRRSKVGFIFVGCETNKELTKMVTDFNGVLVNKSN